MENTEAVNDNNCVVVEGKDVWPEHVKNYMIELMVEEVKKGSKITTTFTKLGWFNIKNGLKSKFNKDYTEEQLKNKFNLLRRRHRDFKGMISGTRVSFIAATGKVAASDDRWEKWSKQAIKGITGFRKNGCPEYNNLCILFGDTTASGTNAFVSTQEVSDSSGGQSREDNEEGFVVAGDATEHAKEAEGKAKVKGKKRKANKSTYSTAVEKAIISMAEEAKRKNDRHDAKTAASSVKGPMNEVSSQDKDLDIMTECMKVLDEMEVDGSVFVKAIDVLHDNPLKRGLFLRMTEKRKKEWLQGLV